MDNTPAHPDNFGQIAPIAGDHVRDLLRREDIQAQIGQALMGVVSGPGFAEQAIMAAYDPDLRECSGESLFRALLQCASMGLTPGKAHGLVALIPRGQQVTCMPQWQGLKVLMERVPDVRRVTPVLVHRKDTFTMQGLTPAHVWSPFDDGRTFRHPSDLGGDPPDLVGGYLVIAYKDGSTAHHFVSHAKIEKNRSCSEVPDMTKRGKPGVWRSWYGEQCLKTVIRDAWARRAVAYDPCASPAAGHHLSAATDADNAATGATVTPKVAALPKPAEKPAKVRRTHDAPAFPFDGGSAA